MILTTVVAGLLAAVVFTVPAVQAAPDPDAAAPPSTGAEPTPAPAPDADAEPAPDADAEPAPEAGAEPAPEADAEPAGDVGTLGGLCFGETASQWGKCTYAWFVPGTNRTRAAAEFVSFKGHKKGISVCDNKMGDGNIGLGVQVDPSGPQAPIIYHDQNGPANSRCFTKNIGYSVRKWRFVSVYESNGRLHDAPLGWSVRPLPRPDW